MRPSADTDVVVIFFQNSFSPFPSFELKNSTEVGAEHTQVAKLTNTEHMFKDMLPRDMSTTIRLPLLQTANSGGQVLTLPTGACLHHHDTNQTLFFNPVHKGPESSKSNKNDSKICASEAVVRRQLQAQTVRVVPCDHPGCLSQLVSLEQTRPVPGNRSMKEKGE